jgi:hypothetical protein
MFIHGVAIGTSLILKGGGWFLLENQIVIFLV